MKLVIEIPEELYDALLNGYEEPYSRMFSDVVRNGTPLPPHGDLIDRDALIARGCYWETEYEMSKAPTIIEADKESE